VSCRDVGARIPESSALERGCEARCEAADEIVARDDGGS
jgi:hypothetical protein